MVDKIDREDTNIVDSLPLPERSLANPARISRFDTPAESQGFPDVDGPRTKGSREQKRQREDEPRLFDFAFHPPTDNDVLNLKIVGFSLIMAVGTMILGFAIAGGILKVF